MAAATQTLGLESLRDFYVRKTPQRAQQADRATTWVRDHTLLAGLRLNILETGRFLCNQPTFEAFEEWVLERNGGHIEEARLDRIRRALAGETVESELPLDNVEGLSELDLAHWDEHGYVILRNAVTPEAAEAAELAIYEHLKMARNDPQSWYNGELGHSIWVPLLRHPAIVANRYSPRIMKAFAQLWGRDSNTLVPTLVQDLWTTIDQGGLNPPEKPGWPFPGPHLHWDTTIAPPHHFGIQGILYLVDVAEDQGAFSCVPGFHKTLQPWLDSLPEGADARRIALTTLNMKPIAANRGDMVLWHQSLPHGASPNTSTRPRVAQYISMRPTRFGYHTDWR